MLHNVPDAVHGPGLSRDLETLSRLLIARRKALAFLTTAGTAVAVAACNGEDGTGSSDSSSDTSTGSDSSSSDSSSTDSSSSSDSSSTSDSSASADSCIADPTETNGPYPADGTNTSNGATSNVLTVSGIVRSDIRSSFITSTTTAEGVQLRITLKLVDAGNACAPIEGAAIYLWHCDANGAYSLYSSGAITESYLRGVQVTDANGEVTFTTIYPACYSGRWPHIHFEVYRNGLTSASTGRTATLISQLAMPAAINTAVFTGSSLYSASLANYKAISLSSDNVFGDNTSDQIAQMTPALSGSVSEGYTGSAVIGLA